MADPKDTVYRAEPHTLAKHQILREYLKRWLPILARQSTIMGLSNQRLLYIDGFAGAGEYTDSIPGSPLVAIQTALACSLEFTVPIQIKLIELRPDRVNHLRRLVANVRPELATSGKIIVDEPIEGDCEEVTNQIITERERLGRGLGPALFFLDQFGYSSFSMNLIGRILSHTVCEVFSYLNWNLMHPFMSDVTKHAGITKAFGGDAWMKVVGLTGKAKEDCFCDVYMSALRDKAGATYSYPFAMRDHNDRVIYWLFFCGNNRRGLEEMKRAMWTVDRSGGFQFSDKHAMQLGSLFSYEDDNLANDMVSALDGSTMSVAEVEEYVLIHTPAVNYKAALALLERRGELEIVEPPENRRRGAFQDCNLRVRFRSRARLKEMTLFD